MHWTFIAAFLISSKAIALSIPVAAAPGAPAVTAPTAVIKLQTALASAVFVVAVVWAIINVLVIESADVWSVFALAESVFILFWIVVLALAAWATATPPAIIPAIAPTPIIPNWNMNEKINQLHIY